MDPVFRIDLAERLASGEPIVLELGCGRAPHPGAIGIDAAVLPGVDIVADLEKGLPYFPDRTVDRIRCRSVLEHLESFEMLMAEFARVLKPDGTCHVFVPHFSNPYYYSDYTHRRFFGLYTFYYFVPRARQLKRTVPDYYSPTKIRIQRIRLRFTSPFKGRRAVKKLLAALFNSSRWMQEFYEENLCWLMPCYGIEVVFSPEDQPS